MGYELIITEKPNAAKKIAEALDNGKPVKESNQGVPYYKVTHGNKDIIVGCAVGHLYSVVEAEKDGWKYPVFNIKWDPAGDAKKGSGHTKKYLSTLKKLSKDAKEFTVATDYDIEGEVIGWNVVRFACKQKDANRMKFSTLTKPDLVKAYEKKSGHIDWGQAYAGETRHFLDWIYGINLSRALSLSIKRALNRHKILSTGRVQGPALKILVDREREIKAFKPEPFWQIPLEGETPEGKLNAMHKEEKFWDKGKAETALKNAKGNDGKISDITKKEFHQEPPTPFDLTTLQTEAYRTLNLSPKHTLQIAQALYTEGYISYPRTSSQKLPKEIEYVKIIEELKKQDKFLKECSELLKKGSLKPHEGKKTDPAHPAIYPTGLRAKLAGKEGDLYELIVRRFLATFGDPAIRETMKVEIDVNGEPFVSKGTLTKVKGWHEFYGRFVMLKEEELPAVKKGETVKVKKIKLDEKETQPPKRYTPASIIKELDKQNLGTKATRAQIIDSLYQRGYIDGKSMEATELGIITVEILEKYCPEILDAEMTREIEEQMEEVREGKKKEEQVLDEAKTVLTKILDKFKQKEMQIGKELGEATEETQKKLATIGPCPKCGKGTLMIKKGKFGRFIACDKYPDCKTTFSIPHFGTVKSAEKECEHCKYPQIIIKTGKIPRTVCLNPDCPSKQQAEELEKKIPCEKCKKGVLVLKKSIYGAFYGCSEYPKCKFTKKIEE